MEKEKILAAAQKETIRGKEYENEEQNKSYLVAFAIELLLGVALGAVEYFIKNYWNLPLIILGATTFGIQMLYSGIRLKKWFYKVVGILFLMIALLFLSYFIWGLIIE